MLPHSITAGQCYLGDPWDFPTLKPNLTLTIFNFNRVGTSQESRIGPITAMVGTEYNITKLRCRICYAQVPSKTLTRLIPGSVNLFMPSHLLKCVFLRCIDQLNCLTKPRVCVKIILAYNNAVLTNRATKKNNWCSNIKLSQVLKYITPKHTCNLDLKMRILTTITFLLKESLQRRNSAKTLSNIRVVIKYQ